MDGGSTGDCGDGPQRLGLLASALAGRTVAVAPADPGEPAWTDGNTVFVDASADPGRQLEAVTVQASLLAGGGLEPDMVRKLVRRPGLARRYLAVEGHRALAANDELLPCRVRSLIDLDLAGRADSPAGALAVAGGSDAVGDPPPSFGVIKARSLLAAHAAAQRTDAGVHNPRRESRKALAEMDDSADAPDEDVMDPFASPVGGGGVAGKLLQRLMSRVRQLSGGPPGSDSPTHKSHKGIRGGGAVVSTASALSGTEDPGAGDGQGRKYPEWDVHRRRYRPDWCTVHEIDAPRTQGTRLARPDVHALRRPLTRLGIGLDRSRRQAQGDDIDVDAAVEARVETLAGSTPDEAVYLDSLRRRRDLAVLVLLDVSGSAAEAGTFGHTVHEQQRAAAAALVVALHELGDRVALYAFQSQGRASVNLVPVKRFDDSLDALVMQRLGSLTPGAYSRLGAAIRHGTSVIAETAGTSRRLLVVLSDGLAYDHGYERLYGAADVRRALGEARRQGIGCLCLTIGAGTDSDDFTSTAFQNAWINPIMWNAFMGWTGVDQYDEGNEVGQRFLDKYEAKYGRRPEYCVPVVNCDVATTLLRAFTDAHPLSPRGVKDALERVKMMPAAAGAPGTRVSFGNWTRRAWMGAGYLVARQLDADGVNSHLVDRFGQE